MGRKVGRFLVLAKLGQGGMATVWRARDELLGREVALKVLDPQLGESSKVRRRFLHEARTVASLDHPGAVAVFDSGEFEGDAYIAMRLVEGETLSEKLARRLIPVDEAVRIVKDVADVLAHAHAKGVVHRDVTSRNVMIGRDGRVFVLDFGLALANWETRVTSTGAVLGTVPYMAPEVLLGEEADARSDLYSLGVVLYEALTGASPHGDAGSPMSTYAALNREPVPPSRRRPEIGPELEALVLRAIAREPDTRFQTAEGFLKALAESASSEGGVKMAIPPAHSDPIEDRLEASPRPDHPDRPDPMYLAVLRFTWEPSNSEDSELKWFSDRLAETVPSALANVRGVRLVTPTLGDLGGKPLSAIARVLGANALLTGTLRQEGATLRATYGVVDAAGVCIAGGVVDGSVMRLFDLEDRLVESIRTALGYEAQPESPTSKPRDPAATDRYRQALGYLRRYDSEASVDGAINVLRRLVQTDGDVAKYHATLARAYLRKRDLSKDRSWDSRAAAECQNALDLSPEDAEVQVAHGELLLRAGQVEAAQAAFEGVLRREPQNLEARFGGARTQMALGCLTQAERLIEAALQVAEDDWRCHLLLGRIHFKAGAYEKALASWKRVIDLAPDNAMALRYTASAYYALDRHEEAAREFQASLRLVPNEETYSNLGTTLYFLGRDEEALAALRKATELAPTDPVRWGNLGNACRWIPGHERESDLALDRAILLMKDALDGNPRQAEEWARLSGWLANRGHLGEAKSALERALALEPDNVYCLSRAGFLHHQLGNREECLRWFRRARARGYGVAELKSSRELESLRRDPEFLGLLEDPGTNLE